VLVALDVLDFSELPHPDATLKTTDKVKTRANRRFIKRLSVGQASACLVLIFVSSERKTG